MGAYQDEVNRLKAIYNQTRERYTLKSAIQSLQPQARGKGKLDGLAGGRPISGLRGSGIGSAPATGASVSSSAGIASPLTETDGTRTYHANQTLTSSDGLLTLEFAPVNQVTMTDANSAEVRMVYAVPA